jgi:hypothetical protein
MDHDRPDAQTALSGISARWAALDPALRRRIVWIATLAVIVLIVVAVFALGAAPRCRTC